MAGGLGHSRRHRMRIDRWIIKEQEREFSRNAKYCNRCGAWIEDPRTIRTPEGSGPQEYCDECMTRYLQTTGRILVNITKPKGERKPRESKPQIIDGRKLIVIEMMARGDKKIFEKHETWMVLTVHDNGKMKIKKGEVTKLISPSTFDKHFKEAVV